jgi:hypothetical protein
MQSMLGFSQFILESSERDKFHNFEIALDPTTPPEDLVILAGDPDNMIRYGVATNPSTPIETLYALSQDEVGSVARTARKNPSFKDDAIGFMFKDFE